MKAVEWRRKVKQERDKLLAEAENAEARRVAEVRAVNAEVKAKREAAHVLDKLLAEDSKAPEPDDENGNDDPESAEEDAPAPEAEHEHEYE